MVRIEYIHLKRVVPIDKRMR